MTKKSEDFSMQQVMKLASSPAGQQLLAFLQSSNSGQMEQATKLVAAGEYAKAAKLLETTLSSEQAQKLMKQLGG